MGRGRSAWPGYVGFKWEGFACPWAEETLMEVQESGQLLGKKCVPCEGGVDPCPLPFVQEQLVKLPGWYLTENNQRIRKDWELNNFVEGLDFFQKVGVIAEAEGPTVVATVERRTYGCHLDPQANVTINQVHLDGWIGKGYGYHAIGVSTRYSTSV